jgi:hypothetical protein
METPPRLIEEFEVICDRHDILVALPLPAHLEVAEDVARRRLGEVSATLRRNTSRTCWVVRRESIRPARSAEGGEAEDTALGVGVLSLGS